MFVLCYVTIDLVLTSTSPVTSEVDEDREYRFGSNTNTITAHDRFNNIATINLFVCFGIK